MPVNVGVVSLVIRSLEDDPVSLAASSTGAEGAAGAMVSIVTVSVEDGAERFPAASQTRAVIACTPFANALDGDRGCGGAAPHLDAIGVQRAARPRRSVRCR